MLLTLRLRGIHIRLIPMRWSDTGETYPQKQERIMNALIRDEPARVILVGESAGGAMAIRMLMDYEQSIAGVVTICGYLHGASGINPQHDILHPAFVKTVQANDKSLERLRSLANRVTTLYSEQDSVVAGRYSYLKGMKRVVLQGSRHQLPIVGVVLSGKFTR